MRMLGLNIVQRARKLSSVSPVCSLRPARGCCITRAKAAEGVRQFSAAQVQGKLFVSGWSNSGALGLGDDVTRAKVLTHVPTEGTVVSVACAKTFTLFATDTGKVYAMGDNSNGELGNSTAGKTQTTPLQVEGLDGVNIVQVAAGLHHGLAVSDKGQVFSWGWGGSNLPGGDTGALGHGDRQNQPVPKCIAGLEGIHVVQAACGSKHSLALDADGNVYTWGLGQQGRLGHGNNTGAR